VKTWRETGTGPFALQGRHGENGKPSWEMPIYPYPTKTGWNAFTSTFQPVDGPRGGVERIAERFLPPAAE
jgi:feruloyl esterase